MWQWFGGRIKKMIAEAVLNKMMMLLLKEATGADRSTPIAALWGPSSI